MGKYITIENEDKPQNNITINEKELEQLNFNAEVYTIRLQGLNEGNVALPEPKYRDFITAYYKKFIRKTDTDSSNRKAEGDPQGTPHRTNSPDNNTPAFLNNNLSRVKTQGQIFLDAIEKLKEPSKDIMSDSEPDNIKYRCIEMARDKVAEAVFWAEKGV